ncbi:MAG: glycosyltransferase [Candidatus Eisenbacteria bacterium]|uniref:Glycosyltransferase n=1 Tax=Eiseniibacteriota bacterium TaxID=2212470 RepID=A0A7Y2E782_UNCEI|nr:glycosyltransferase [Candidatus Eisenbacteria bacterium]
MKVDISVVVPAFNEAESLPELIERNAHVLTSMNRTWEVIVIDDGSTDNSFEVLEDLQKTYSALRFFSFRRNYGKSAALEVGFGEAEGKYIITMDADLQDDPAEIPELIGTLESGYDLVSGWKKVRHDPISKTLPSKLFNRVTSMVAGIRLHDFNCGLKGYRSVVAKGLPVYGEMHRFLPAISHWQGYRVTEIPVQHHSRKHGQSKFGPARFVNGFLDLMTVSFVHSGKRSPLHIFGRIGLFLGLIGLAILSVFLFGYLTGQGVRMRPIFFIALILVIIAMQFVSLGLLGELVVKGHARPKYRFRTREDDDS